MFVTKEEFQKGAEKGERCLIVCNPVDWPRDLNSHEPEKGLCDICEQPIMFEAGHPTGDNVTKACVPCVRAFQRIAQAVGELNGGEMTDEMATDIIAEMKASVIVSGVNRNETRQ
jgi:hypothetical protein